MSDQDQAVAAWNEYLDDLFDRIRQTCDECDHPGCAATIKAAKETIYTICQKAEREARLDEFMTVTGIFNASGVELSPRFSAMQLRDKLLDHQKQLQSQLTPPQETKEKS